MDIMLILLNFIPLVADIIMEDLVTLVDIMVITVDLVVVDRLTLISYIRLLDVS